MVGTHAYRCDGCGSEYEVTGSPRPTLLCPDCDIVAEPYGDDAALSAYRVAHARYTESRRQLTAALENYEAGSWSLARGSLEDAASEFETAVERFTEAVTRADDDALAERAEIARKKASCLWKAVEWLSGAAYAYDRGSEDRGDRYQRDARRCLTEAREYGALPDPERLAVDPRDVPGD